MVAYYSPATAVAMFGRTGSGYHHHHHHSPPTQNHPYFTPGAYGAGYHHHNPHPHHAGHQPSAVAGGSAGSGSPVGGGLGVGGAGLTAGVNSTQFSSTMATDFNCNHQYNPHFGNMTPDSMAVAAAAAAAASSPWATQSSMYSSACAAAAARNAAAVAAGLSSVAPPPPPPPSVPHGSSYEEWSNVTGGHPHHPHHMHPHAYQHHPHPSFYNHHATSQQPSPPSSTPSSPSSSHSPSHHVYSTSSTTPNNNNNSSNNNSSTFKTEFGPCSGGNNQDASSQEMPQTNPGNSTSVAVVSSAGPSIGTPHSPDSGMAISDGVSSSGSPATNNGQPFHHTQHCLGGPSSNSSGSSSTNHSSSANPATNGNCSAATNGSDNSQQQQQQQQFATSGGNMVHGMGSHHNHHGHGHLHNMNSSHPSSGNLNHHHHSHHQALASGHASGIVNVTSSGRPTQARSPYEWMKKPTYSCSSSGSNPSTGNSKTRTKDKYRVVYSDTQRLELEKEFHYSRYITIRRKAELASILGLSERQVKIWFQNRRAKERKVQRKHEEMLQREKLATMVHMQNAAVAAAGGMGGGMCNQPPGGSVPLSALM